MKQKNLKPDLVSSTSVPFSVPSVYNAQVPAVPHPGPGDGGDVHSGDSVAGCEGW